MACDATSCVMSDDELTLILFPQNPTSARVYPMVASVEPDGTLKIVVPDDAVEHRNKARTPPTEKIEVKPSSAA
jgi:hypothetical protein